MMSIKEIKNRKEIMTQKIVIADRFMTLESVKPNKDCNVCDNINDYICFDHEHQQIKKGKQNDNKQLRYNNKVS